MPTDQTFTVYQSLVELHEKRTNQAEQLKNRLEKAVDDTLPEDTPAALTIRRVVENEEEHKQNLKKCKGQNSF